MRRFFLLFAPLLYLGLASHSCERSCDDPKPSVCFGPNGPADGRYVGFVTRRGADQTGSLTADSVAVRVIFSDGQYTVEPLGTSPAFEVPGQTGTFVQSGHNLSVPNVYNFTPDQGTPAGYDFNLLLTREWSIQQAGPNRLGMVMYAPTAFFSRVYQYQLHPEL